MMRNKVFDAAGGFVTLDVRAFPYPPANDLRLGWSDFHGAVAYLIPDARDRPVVAAFRPTAAGVIVALASLRGCERVEIGLALDAYFLTQTGWATSCSAWTALQSYSPPGAEACQR